MAPAGPVIWSDELYEVARYHAMYMRQRGHFSHVSHDGKDVGDRFDLFNYQWDKVGENLARGEGRFSEILEAWLKSPSHCTLLMDPAMIFMGLSKDGRYWVQTFSKPAGFAQR